MRTHHIQFLLIVLALLTACSQLTAPPANTPTAVDRLSRIPSSAVKVLPEDDVTPPLLLSDAYQSPVPLPGEVNSAGAEDSPFITPDGQTLYFFFTPDVKVPVEKQILDGVTGLYVSHLVNGSWSSPQRILLQDPGKLSMDGCEFVLGNVMWFCSAREGYTGMHWFTAEYRDDRWQSWQNADFDPGYQVGELHISADGSELFFHSGRPGGKGGLDIWVSQKMDGRWQEPVNISAMNTPDGEGWPALNPADPHELWFYRNYAIWRAKKEGGEWQAPEQIVKDLAGEPSLDNAGNLYFVHHFYNGDQMIEADIYVAYRK